MHDFENFTLRLTLRFSFQFDQHIQSAKIKSGIEAKKGATGVIDITSAIAYDKTPPMTDKTPDQNETFSNVSDIHSIGKSWFSTCSWLYHAWAEENTRRDAHEANIEEITKVE